MRYGIISDIHGNLEALQAVLIQCRHLRVDTILCTGDIVGYGADPKECLDIVRSLKAVTIAGNHDWAVSGRLDFSYFTDDGQAAVMWTRGTMAFEDIAYLNTLPLCLKNEDCIVVHSSLNEPQHFIYLTDAARSVGTFALMDVPVCFVGHTHVPKAFIQRGGNIIQSEGLNIEIDPKYKYIINVGSVGQPRDGNPMSSFCIYDTRMQMVQHYRIPYNIKAAQQKIVQAGLPKTLALRLAQGR